MSRIGKHPVPIPAGVDVTVNGQQVSAKGKLGELSVVLIDDILAKLEDGKVVVSPRSDTRRARIMWGTSRTLVNNLLVGVSKGYTVNLEINGVGYRAAVQGAELVLQLGYSHRSPRQEEAEEKAGADLQPVRRPKATLPESLLQPCSASR